MIPVGYLAKRVVPKPEGLKASQVVDIFSVSNCVNDDFADYIGYWKHNGYWLFDSPEIMRGLAEEHAISLDGISLFYYEAYELEFDGRSWSPVTAEPSLETRVSSASREAGRVRCGDLLRADLAGMLSAVVQRARRSNPDEQSLSVWELRAGRNCSQ
jgi:hypothetical protein